VRATVKTGDVEISLQPSKSPGEADDNTVPDDDEINGEVAYGNVQHDEVTAKYRIPVTELHNVINERHTSDGFLKEYEVSVLYISLCGHYVVVSKYCVCKYGARLHREMYLMGFIH